MKHKQAALLDLPNFAVVQLAASVPQNPEKRVPCPGNTGAKLAVVGNREALAAETVVVLGSLRSQPLLYNQLVVGLALENRKAFETRQGELRNRKNLF